MLRAIKTKLAQATAAASRARFTAKVVRGTGALSGLSPAKLAKFAAYAPSTRMGPHVAVMLHACASPDKLALVDGTRRLTYLEMDREINQLAHLFADLGVRPGDRVGLMLSNCAEYVVAQQAIARIGATAVQIGYRLKAVEVAYILENAEPRVLLVENEFVPTTDEARRLSRQVDDAAVIVCRTLGAATGYTRYEDALVHYPVARPPKMSRGEGGAVIVYTSGTTGKPKGASRNLKKTGLEAAADMMRQVGMHQSDRHLVVCPLYHSAAPAFVAFMFSLGATVIIEPHFEAEKILSVIESEGITCAMVVPTMLVRLAALPREVRDRYDTSSLRWIMSGAAPLATDTVRRFQDCYGPIVWNFYGSTETGLVTLAGPHDHGAHPGTVGRSLRGNELRILDDHGESVPPGEVGELYVRNAMLITGYHRNPDATTGSMRDGFFSVGDLARIDHDGFVYLESRKHDMVISGGVNIYPREIEDYLHDHPELVEVAVIGVPDEEWGESLKAFAVRATGSSISEAEVIGYCRDGLANYKCPKSVVFLDELPRNPTGKVLKRELRAC